MKKQASSLLKDTSTVMLVRHQQWWQSPEYRSAPIEEVGGEVHHHRQLGQLLQQLSGEDGDNKDDDDDDEDGVDDDVFTCKQWQSGRKFHRQ